MLAVITHSGTCLIDPVSFKNTSSSFPISSSLECSTNIWSPYDSQLYIANSSSIQRYTPSECLLEELYHGSDTVTCLAMKDRESMLFFAAANKVWSLDCTHSPGGVLSSLEPHKETIKRISMSNDGTLLASVSASAVFVHNLTLSSYTRLEGLPDRKSITCCVFHPHSRTKLLFGVGRDVVVYNSMRPFGSPKTIRIPGGGHVVGVAASPFSKTLVAAVTSNGDVALVDIDKDNGILKTVNVETRLTCCAFTAEGAAIYLGTENGRLLVLDLRSLEKEPKSFTIGDGSVPIKEINVQAKSRSHLTDTVSAKAKSTSTTGLKSSPRRSACSARTISNSSGLKSPERVMVASKIRGGVIPSRKSFTPVRTPLSETRNTVLGARPVSSRSPLSHRMKPLRLQRNNEQEETHVQPPSPASASLEPTNGRRRTKAASFFRMGQDIETLGLGPVPESISGHLVTMGVRSGSHVNDGPSEENEQPKSRSRRVVSEAVESAPTRRKPKPISSQTKGPSSRVFNGVVADTQRKLGRSTTPDNSDDRDLSSPELPQEPVTPISLGKNGTKSPLTSATGSGLGVLRPRSPEVAKRVRGAGSQKGKGKEKAVEEKKTRFNQDPDIKELSVISDEAVNEVEGGWEDEEREKELSMQVSPHRPTAPPMWLQSPHRKSAANPNMNTAAQDFLRNIVHDVMYDFQRDTKAEMMGLHLDLVRMGRGWKQELREIMAEWSEEIRDLKAENRRLREENERLRRGY